MLEDKMQSPEEVSIENCLPDSEEEDQFLNLDFEKDFFEETINNANFPSDVPVSSAMAAAAAAALPCYDPSVPSTYSTFDSSSFLPIPEPDILTSLSDLPMAPIYLTNQLNQMISPNAYASYSPNLMASQIPLDLQPYLGMEPSPLQPCSYIDANGGIGGDIYGDGMGVSTCRADCQLGFFAGAGMAARPPDAMETRGLELYAPISMQRVYAPRDLQVLGDNQLGCSGSAAPLQMASDMPAFEDSSYKIGKLSTEERKEKIDRFLRKRNARNFNKKIKYVCRKTLADSRPRVRGRFAKNDEFGETAPRPNAANLEYDDEAMAGKNEEDLIQSSEILAHLTGLNSFKYDYACQSWL